MAVESGKADAFVGDSVALVYHIEQMKKTTLAILDDYKSQYGGNVGAAFRNDDPDFVDEWNTALDELKDDGTVMKILKKYGLNESYFVNAKDGKTINQ